jgi:hypothetical protein
MEQNDQKKLAAYELATLASRLWPEACVADPDRAIAAAETLITKAANSLARAEWEATKNEREHEEWQRGHSEIMLGWSEGIKYITKEARRDRATQWFTKFVRHGAPADVKGKSAHYKRNGISLDEAQWLEDLFAEWKRQPKPQKGRQGRRISENDGRLRTELDGLVAKKPRKAS